MAVKFATFAVNQEHISLGESMIAMAIKAISVAGMGRFFMDEKEIQKLTSAYEGVCTEIVIQFIIAIFPLVFIIGLYLEVFIIWQKFMFILKLINLHLICTS